MRNKVGFKQLISTLVFFTFFTTEINYALEVKQSHDSNANLPTNPTVIANFPQKNQLEEFAITGDFFNKLLQNSNFSFSQNKNSAATNSINIPSSQWIKYSKLTKVSESHMNLNDSNDPRCEGFNQYLKIFRKIAQEQRVSYYKWKPTQWGQTDRPLYLLHKYRLIATSSIYQWLAATFRLQLELSPGILTSENPTCFNSREDVVRYIENESIAYKTFVEIEIGKISYENYESTFKRELNELAHYSGFIRSSNLSDGIEKSNELSLFDKMKTAKDVSQGIISGRVFLGLNSKNKLISLLIGGALIGFSPFQLGEKIDKLKDGKLVSNHLSKYFYFLKELLTDLDCTHLLFYYKDQFIPDLKAIDSKVKSIGEEHAKYFYQSKTLEFLRQIKEI